jgi:protein O-mannosyl-transferase
LPPPEVVTFTEAILSLPGMFVFYIKQVFFPIWMSANYPFQPVSQIGFSNFVMPLITAVIALGVLFYAAKSLPKGKLAASIFLLPLLPAMNALAFMPDQIVHDRYLYLPLLGILMLGVAAASKYLSSTNLISAAVVISLICGYITLSYNFAWQNEIALWQWSRTVDDSSFTARQLGSAYAEAERNPDAIKAFTDSINKKSTAYALLGRGRAAARTNDFQTAERDLKAIIDMPDEALDVYTLYQAYEGLGLVYTGSNRPADAERNFIKARERLPIYSAALTTNLAIVLYQKGDKARALQELEAVRGKARVEMLPESKAALLRLGMLYAEMGKRSEASVALNEYLTLTAALKDKNSVADRTLAMQQLQALR